MKKIIVLLLFFTLLFVNGCSSDKNDEPIEASSTENAPEIIEETETKEIQVWPVAPTLEFDDIDNWLTTRKYGHSSIIGSGESASSIWPLDDYSISYNRNDFYNSEGKDSFIIGSFEKGGAIVTKDGMHGLIDSKGKIVTDVAHKYRTHQKAGVIFDTGNINHDYTINEREFAGGGSGISFLFLNKDGKVFCPVDSLTASTLIEIDLFDKAVEQGYVDEDGFILLNTFASIIDHDNYLPELKLPNSLIEAYVIINKEGYKVLSIPRNYVVNDFSEGIICFAGCNTDPRSIKPETLSDGTLSDNALMMFYYAYELYCDRYSYSDFTFVDKEGNIIASGFEDAYGFYDGYAAVKKNGKWGYIDKEGNIVIDYIFDKATALSDGSAWVIYKGKTGKLNIAELLENNITVNDETLQKDTVQFD